DPFANILTGGDISLYPACFETFTRDAIVGGAEVHVATLGPDAEDIIGVGLWYGPGQSFGATERQQAVHDELFFSKCTEELKKWWLENVRARTAHTGMYR
ncbi:hypothetical protein H0H92_003395, partial [Tricholoma furcatifolium]